MAEHPKNVPNNPVISNTTANANASTAQNFSKLVRPLGLAIRGFSIGFELFTTYGFGSSVIERPRSFDRNSRCSCPKTEALFAQRQGEKNTNEAQTSSLSIFVSCCVFCGCLSFLLHAVSPTEDSLNPLNMTLRTNRSLSLYLHQRKSCRFASARAQNQSNLFLFPKPLLEVCWRTTIPSYSDLCPSNG